MINRTEIPLSDKDKIGEGMGRLVYRHPQRADVVIKIAKSRPPKKFHKLRMLLSPTKRRFRTLVNSWVEIFEGASIIARNNAVPNFISQFLGFVPTSQGIGAMFEAAVDENGVPLKTLLKHAPLHGHETQMVAAIDALWTNIREFRAIITDSHLGNVMVSGTADTGYHLMLIDGLGEKTVIPVLQISQRVYDRDTAKRADKMLQDYAEATSGNSNA